MATLAKNKNTMTAKHLDAAQQKNTYCPGPVVYSGPAITHGEPLTDRKSVFQAHAACVQHVSQVEDVVAELMRNNKIARAAHNIMAYRIVHADTGVIEQDNNDD